MGILYRGLVCFAFCSSKMAKGAKGKGKGKGKNKNRSYPIEKKVWVGGVPEDFDAKKFKEHMSQVPGCKFVSVKKGQGAVGYNSEEEAQAAIAELTGSVFEGATIEVDVWTKKEKE